jgi:glutamyl-tRNA reductase
VTDPIVVAVARAGAVDAAQRARLAAAWQSTDGVLLETCHRVERYSTRGGAADAAGVRVLSGSDAVRHAIEVAVGLDSVVLAEDQVLSQLRGAVASSHERGPVDPRISHLMDLALRTGRRARSWLPARRPTLADLAFERSTTTLEGQRVLVVGAGRMGELAARAAAARGARVAVASRTPARANALAARLGVEASALDPLARIADYAVIVVALAGPWAITDVTAAALAMAGTAVIDLSSPPAVPAELRSSLDGRFHSIDDLASSSGEHPDHALVARLQWLTDEAVKEYDDWALRQDQRDTARAVAERSERIREGELEALWRRVPPLPDEARIQIEQMTERLAARLLQEPLSRLGSSDDDARVRVARELFDL